MASIDLPTNINYVLSKTNAKKLTYIGHSEVLNLLSRETPYLTPTIQQGTIQAFAGFIDKSLAAKVNLFIALAPVAYVGHIRSPLMQTLSTLELADIEYLLGVREFTVGDAASALIPEFCRYQPYPCNEVLEVLMGPSVNTNISRMAYYLSFEPNPTSIKNMIHWY